MKGLFVTGTGTEVGKTLVACAIARSLKNKNMRVGVAKPAASGGTVQRIAGKSCLVSEDARLLQRAAGSDLPLDVINPVCFKNPLAPYTASKIEKKRYSYSDMLRGCRDILYGHDFTVVEGVGGALVPLSRDKSVADLMLDLGLPVLVTASAKLGTLNHTLLTLEALEKRNIPLAGVVLNFYDAKSLTDSTNLAFFEEKRIPVLAVFPEDARFRTDLDGLAACLSGTRLSHFLFGL